jgi:hypothetical protein
MTTALWAPSNERVAAKKELLADYGIGAIDRRNSGWRTTLS